MPGFARRFLQGRSGATAIEYALIAGLIAAVIATAVGALGAQLSGAFGTVAAAVP